VGQYLLHVLVEIVAEEPLVAVVAVPALLQIAVEKLLEEAALVDLLVEEHLEPYELAAAAGVVGHQEPFLLAVVAAAVVASEQIAEVRLQGEVAAVGVELQEPYELAVAGAEVLQEPYGLAAAVGEEHQGQTFVLVVVAALVAEQIAVAAVVEVEEVVAPAVVVEVVD